MRTILYLSYDGLTDPLGQSQILAYLKRLSAYGNRIVIVSFEKPDLFEKGGEAIRQICTEHGLVWKPRQYTKRPPVLSTLYDVWRCSRVCDELHRQYRFQIVHCRGYITALTGLHLKKKYGLKFIFDMRGWWADEKKESGFWNGRLYQPVYNFFKKKEKAFFLESDRTVSLTLAGKKEIEEQYGVKPEKIGVIPTCVDFEIFQPNTGAKKAELKRGLGISAGEKVFVYSGSLGGNYDVTLLISAFTSFRKNFPSAYLLILSKDEPTEEIRALFSRAGITRMSIYNVPFLRVTDYVRAGDYGFIYYRMSFSVIGRSPTKMGEYWASGLPVISFRGIGDLDHLLASYPKGGLLLSANPENWEGELALLPPATEEELRAYAEDYFHIDRGVAFYQNIYATLAPPDKTERIASDHLSVD